MAEKKLHVRAYKVRMYCDEPGCQCEMVATGIVLMSNPPLYQHKDAAGHTQNFAVQYPTVVYEEYEVSNG